MNPVNAIFRFERKLSGRAYGLLTVAGAVSMLTVWSVASYSGKIDSLFLPTPAAVVASAATLALEFNLLGDIWASVYRIALGFGLSVIIAVPLGVWIGIHKQTEAFLTPLTSFFRYTPVSAYIPLFILWFGIGELEKISVIFLAIVPYLIVLVADTVANTKKEYAYAALTLGAQTKHIFFSIVLPQSMPGIWDSMRITIGFGWAFVILAEVVAATSGLGHLIVISQRFLKISNVMAAIVVIGLLGLATDMLFKLGYRYFFPWTDKSRHA
ncbi:ABC transporter permease [Candidatus Kaiserbacteria bacterium]|nr:ABC transporter permease [Candidatus Kaiserbacteria bacterium]